MLGSVLVTEKDGTASCLSAMSFCAMLKFLRIRYMQ